MIYIFKFFDIQSNKPLEFEEDFSFVQLDIIKFDNKKKLSRIRNAGNINGANKTTNSTLKKQEKTNDEMPLNDITNDVIKEAIRLKYETIREIQDVYPQSIQNQKAYLICDQKFREHFQLQDEIVVNQGFVTYKIHCWEKADKSMSSNMFFG